MLIQCMGFSWCILGEGDTVAPEIRNTRQDKYVIRPGESVLLSAQGRDDVSLGWAWLMTNESGEWKRVYTGLPGWLYSRQIVIHHEFVEGDLVDFPVFIRCTFSDFISRAQSDGDDFVFVNVSGQRLSHEIEYYNSGTGELTAWVKIPFLSASTDTVLYLCYGNSTCGNQEDKEGTWSNGFIMVHHMSGSSWDKLKDSSSNHWDVSSMGGNPAFNQVGMINNCVGFGGAGDYLKVNKFCLPVDSSYTGSAWVYVDGKPGERRYVFEGDGDYGISLQVCTNESFLSTSRTSTGAIYCYSTTKVNVSNPKWFYVCTRADALLDLLDIFVNGKKENSVQIQGVINQENQGLNIGTYRNNNANWMKGLVDEIRVSNVPRSDAWIKTEYNNIAYLSSFMSFSDGSPMRMIGNDQWQWVNFTWFNPSVPVGSRVGFRVFFNDSSGNQVGSSILSVLVLYAHNPPNTPIKPRGATSCYIGVESVYSVDPVIDPDNDPVYYMFDWGDGNDSGWIETPSAVHKWSNTGVYNVRVKARDVYYEESGWSELLSVEVYSVELGLLMECPSSVVEGESFTVSVSVAGVPVSDAEVSFVGRVFVTDNRGEVVLVAPMVECTTEYMLVVNKAGYRSGSAVVLVLDGERARGWIWGRVSSKGVVVSGADVCALLVGGGVTPVCSVTDGDGLFSLLVPVGTYRVEVSKEGYVSMMKHSILVRENEAVGVNFHLESLTGGFSSSKKDLFEYVIQYGVKEGMVGGEIFIQRNGSGAVLTYDARLSLELVSAGKDDVFRCLVSGSDGINGTVLAFQIEDPSVIFNQRVVDLQGVVVEFDGERIDMASDSGDVFGKFRESDKPLWAGLLTKKLYILVLVPGFSEHEITISYVGRVTGVGGILGVLTYFLTSVFVFGVFVAPMLFNIVRRRRYLRGV
ncbi:MAG: DUF2341 domain-containing protein [Candidatus Thermoplasmatota archaeon]